MPIFGSKVGRVARHLVNQQLIVKLNFIFISDANAETKVLLIKFHHFEAANLFSFQLASESKNCSAGVFREIVPAVFFPNLVFGGSDAIPMLSVRLFRSKPNSDASFSTFDRKTSFFFHASKNRILPLGNKIFCFSTPEFSKVCFAENGFSEKSWRIIPTGLFISVNHTASVTFTVDGDYLNCWKTPVHLLNYLYQTC